MSYLQLYSFKSDKGLKKTPVIRRCHSINSGSLNITSTIHLNNLVLQAFGPDSTQEEVYNETTKHLVQNVIEGYNATVFAYGATGTVVKHQGRRIYGGGGGDKFVKLSRGVVSSSQKQYTFSQYHKDCFPTRKKHQQMISLMAIVVLGFRLNKRWFSFTLSN